MVAHTFHWGYGGEDVCVRGNFTRTSSVMMWPIGAISWMAGRGAALLSAGLVRDGLAIPLPVCRFLLIPLRFCPLLLFPRREPLGG